MGKNIFNSIKMPRIKSNFMDHTHDVKMSFRAGELTPVMLMDAMPGDTFNCKHDFTVKLSPWIAPAFHRFNITLHTYFVPRRILWPNWENFITNTKVTGNLPVHPFITMASGDYTRLADYMGIPTPIGGNTEEIDALPFFAYQKVVNDWYRDENLMTNVWDDTLNGGAVDGNNSASLAVICALRNRCWEKDYFTAALPFAQKGDPVELPIAGFEDVAVRHNAQTNIGVGNFDQWDAVTQGPGGGATVDVNVDREDSDDLPQSGQLFIKGSDLVPQNVTVNDLTLAQRIQEWLEINARAGTRYVEHLLGHFDERSSDRRLQRAEYICGTKEPIAIGEIVNTAGEALPQGNMSGNAYASAVTRNGKYHCEEHGFIITIASVLPRTAYQQGIFKTWLRRSPLDFPFPKFAHLGEQQVLNKEIYAYQGTAGEEVFGYVPRYAEMKYTPSRVAGEFRDQLDFWHAGRIFATPPALNATFVQCTNESMARLFADSDPDTDKFYGHFLNRISVRRKLPFFSDPKH